MVIDAHTWDIQVEAIPNRCRLNIALCRWKTINIGSDYMAWPVLSYHELKLLLAHHKVRDKSNLSVLEMEWDTRILQ